MCDLLARNETAIGFFDAALDRYPERLNPTALWMSATARYR
ncbi:hypothetical protein [Nocardia sp. NPDC052112]